MTGKDTELSVRELRRPSLVCDMQGDRGSSGTQLEIPDGNKGTILPVAGIIIRRKANSLKYEGARFRV